MREEAEIEEFIDSLLLLAKQPSSLRLRLLSPFGRLVRGLVRLSLGGFVDGLLHATVARQLFEFVLAFEYVASAATANILGSCAKSPRYAAHKLFVRNCMIRNNLYVVY